MPTGRRGWSASSASTTTTCRCSPGCGDGRRRPAPLLRGAGDGPRRRRRLLRPRRRGRHRRRPDRPGTALDRPAVWATVRDWYLPDADDDDARRGPGRPAARSAAGRTAPYDRQPAEPGRPEEPHQRPDRPVLRRGPARRRSRRRTARSSATPPTWSCPSQTRLEIAVLKGIAAHYVMRADDRVAAMLAPARAARRAGRGARQARRRRARPAVRRRLARRRRRRGPAAGRRRPGRLADRRQRRRPARPADRRSASWLSPLVWLPFDPARLGDPPARPALRDGSTRPSTCPTRWPTWPSTSRRTPSAPAGADGAAADDQPPGRADAHRGRRQHPRAASPTGVTLCNGRGIHDTSTAELALTLILASLRGVPGFVRAQDRREWEFGWHPALADKRVLLVGYGAIGAGGRGAAAAVRGRGRPRGPRRPRRRPRASTSCPTCCRTADVVVLLVPLTDATRGLVDAGFLARMKDGALLVNVARGAVVVTDDLVAGARHRADQRRHRRRRPGAAARRQPAVDRPQPADLAARRRRQQRDVAARQPARPRPAAPVRRR